MDPGIERQPIDPRPSGLWSQEPPVPATLQPLHHEARSATPLGLARQPT